jgi:hypothetical protein
MVLVLVGAWENTAACRRDQAFSHCADMAGPMFSLCSYSFSMRWGAMKSSLFSCSTSKRIFCSMDKKTNAVMQEFEKEEEEEQQLRA